MYGHDRIAQFWKKMNQPVKVAFFSALSIGLLVYLFAMTNLFFTTGDTLNNVYFTGELTWLGRWSSKWLSSLSTSYTMPYVNGVIVIFSVAALSALLVSYFEIKSSVLALLSAGVMMCYPSVAKTLGYLHNADAYMLAAMLSVLGLYLLEKYRWRGFLPSVLLIALGTGTYQACASLVVAMMFVRGVQLLVCSMQSGKALAVRFLQYVMCVAVSLVTYYVLAQLFAGVSRISISDYQSIARSASIDTLLLFPQNFIGCYSDFGNTLYTLADQPDYVVGGWPCILYALLTIGMTFSFVYDQAWPELAKIWRVMPTRAVGSFLSVLHPHF